MLRTHSCLVEIQNKTMFPMTYVRDWYGSGQVADECAWTDVSPDDHLIVNNYERDGSLAGCSGYVTYQVCGTEFSIAFSNPVWGPNKLGVGPDGETTWEDMSNHNYEPFLEDVDLDNGVNLRCICQCTGGDVNNCTVQVACQLSAGSCSPPCLRLART